MKLERLRVSSLLNLKELWQTLCRRVGPQPTLFILTALLSWLTVVSCGQLPTQPLRVAINQWPGYETLYLARSLGYYENTPIQLIDLPSGTEQVRAFRNGNVEAAAISLDQALALASTNPSLRVIAIMDFSEGGDVILAKPAVATLSALKGKRVGVEANALGAYVITRALEQAKLSTTDIQVVSLGLSEHERAFKDGTVDAVVTFGPARTKLLEAGAKQIFDSSKIPGEIVDALIVREDALNNHAEAVVALVKGHFRALDYLQKNPEDGARRIAPRTGVTPKQFLESLAGLRSPSLQENQKLLSKTDPSLLKATQRLASVMQQNQLLPKPIDPRSLLDDRIVKAIQP